MKNIEKSTFRVFYSDGIMDLSFGSILLIFAINTWMTYAGNDISFLMRILIIPLVLSLVAIKIFITGPMVGRVKFTPRRNRKRLAAMLIATLSFIAATTLFYLSVTGRITGDQKDELISLLIEAVALAAIFALLAYFTDYTNFYLVGFAMVIGSPLSIMSEPFLGSRSYTVALMGLAGVALILKGLILLVNYIIKHRANESR